jgi:class 3 adenylate cyclase
VRTRRGVIAQSSDPGALDLRLLGPLEVRRGERLLKLGGSKPRTLLAGLALHLGETVSVDRLIDDLWGESPPDSASHAVEVHVSRLRKELGTALVTRAPGYALALEPDQLDLTRFARRAAEARALSEHDPESAAAILREALALWRGPALAEFAFEPFAQGEIGRLEELRSEALELRIDCDLQLGKADLVPELQALVAAEPLRERLREQLMLALYRQGRQADALAEYRAARSLLMDELGVEPSPSLRALEAAILRQDAALTLPVRPPAQAQRKLATILFADLADSTGLAMSLDPETWRGVQRQYFEVVSAAVARHGGTTEKYVGDAVMAVFGTPVAHEDDALRAARAAVEAHNAVGRLGEALERELGIRLEVRIGVATGEVLTGGPPGDPLATGPAVNVAARLQQEVASGEIAVDELTRRLTIAAGSFRELGALELRGLGRPVRAFHLEGLTAGAAALPRRLDAPFVGRSPELAVLHDALADAVTARALRAVTVSGPAGIGKSRLTRELIEGVADDATVLHGRCLSYGEGATFRPLRDALGSAEGVAAALSGEPDAEAIASSLAAVFGTETIVPADEVPWAFRRYCETLAARRPLVLALDDLHWAEPALLDLVEHLAGSARDVPILLLCVTRDELGEERAGFPAGAAALVLEPLSDVETDTLVDHLLPESALDDETRGRLVAAAEGNPLFLEQLVAHVGETGLLEPPPTLRALLAARLDRLGPGERGVLERAAVVGREFGVTAVTELLDPAATPTVGAHLDVLVRRGFLRPARDEGFRFRHGLIHDAVYRGAPKELRAALHEQLADVLHRSGADDEDVGYHLERAYRLRTELGHSDRHSQRLAEDAGRRLGTAGVRAWKRGEAGGASRLLERAAALLPARDEERRELLCELGIALNTAGETSRAGDVLREADQTAAGAGDRRIELRARIELAGLRLLEAPSGAAAQLLELSSEAVGVFAGIGDDRSLGRTWMLSGWVHGGTYGRHLEWAQHAERALEHYRRAGWPPATCVGHIAAAAYGGPTPAAEAVEKCHRLLELGVGDRASEASVLSHLGGLEAMLGLFDEARELLQRATALYVDLGRAPQVLLTCAPIEAAVARLAGEAADAASILRRSCAALQHERRWFHLATQAAELAHVLSALGVEDEAAEWCSVAERCASTEDLSAQIWWRVARAKILARAARVDEGYRLAGEAAALAGNTDALNLAAVVQLAVAESALARGETEAAERARHAALCLYEKKGNAAAVALLRAEQTAAAAS